MISSIILVSVGIAFCLVMFIAEFPFLKMITAKTLHGSLVTNGAMSFIISTDIRCHAIGKVDKTVKDLAWKTIDTLNNVIGKESCECIMRPHADGRYVGSVKWIVDYEDGLIVTGVTNAYGGSFLTVRPDPMSPFDKFVCKILFHDENQMCGLVFIEDLAGLQIQTV